MSMLANHNAISAGGYTIQRSLRFRGSATAYLSRTMGSPTSQNVWTYSTWIKISSPSAYLYILNSASTNPGENCYIFNGQLYYTANVSGGTSGVQKISAAVFRDPSAWYHIVIQKNASANSGLGFVKIWVNNQEITSWSTNAYFGTQSLTPNYINVSGTVNYINYVNSAASDCYLAEVNFIDGQALTPSSFGQTDVLTGVWTAKKYTGTYGNNGFYLPFTDTSSTTNLVKDSSGNGNNWTPNNISLTAGVTYDSMIDSPTLGAAGTQPVGNYAVLNPLSKRLTNLTLSDANLTGAFGVSGQNSTALSTLSVSSGKWYFEAVSTNGSGMMVGIVQNNAANMNTVATTAAYVGVMPTGYGYYADSNKYNNGVGTAYGATFTTNDIIGTAFDADAGTLVFYKNGVSQGTAFTGITGEYFLAISGGSGVSQSINFGQRPFSYTPPTGFKSLCTTNLPDSTIVKGNQYMDAVLWTGNDVNNRVISGLNLSPDLAWIKCRSTAHDHNLTDIVRGTSKTLASNQTAAEVTNVNGAVSSFDTSSITLTQGSSGFAEVNNTSKTYVAWLWDAGSSTVTNTSGSISSQVRANTTAGVSIVTYTGTGANATVGHGLGVAPKMVIVKRRDNGIGATNWYVYHSGVNGGVNPQQYNLKLNLTNAQAGLTAIWNDTAPTSTVFTVGTNTEVNGSSGTFVAYCFAEIAGFSKFTSYTGNGSTDGVFVYLGFRPKYIMLKRSDAAGPNWQTYDTSRSPYNATTAVLYPNLSNAEANWTNGLDILSNGFKIRESNTDINASGGTYIVAAWAENPFKNSLAR